MTSADWEVVRLAAGWSAVIGAVGLGLAYLVRRRSVRWWAALIAVVGVGAFAVALQATARAMFLSQHDLHVVLVVSVVAGAVALLFSLLLAGWLVRSAEALQVAARRLSDHREAADDSTGEPSGPSELREVAAELRRSRLELAESTERQRVLEQSRRELVAWVSHDLRTPLAGLRAMSEALEDGMATDPRLYHLRIRSEVERMTRMVDDLFELSRIHAGALELNLERIRLEDLVSDVLAATNAIAVARGVRLDGLVPGEIVVTADPNGLARVLTNLVANAIRHTPTDGSVEVCSEQVGDDVVLSVRDECGGIPADELGRVFDVAWRGSNARTPEADDESGGAGLGLAVVRGIVEAHQGTVDVCNVETGCRFSVQLPVLSGSHQG